MDAVTLGAAIALAKKNPGGSGSYTLPTATADALGGVKADPAQSTDTQPVRIGADGKLVTQPGSGSGSYTLPTATADALGGVKADPAQSTDTQPVRIGADGKLVTQPGSGAASAEPHSYALDGGNLLERFTAAQIAEKIAADNWQGINPCDYIPASLTGTYYDFGQARFPVGHDYYSDQELSVVAGQTTAEADIAFLFASVGQITVSGTKYYVPAWDCTAPILTLGASYYSDTALSAEIGQTTRRYLCSAISKDYATVEIDGATYYARPVDCHGSRPITLNAAVVNFEVAAINPYWRYGDNGGLTGNVPHMYMIPRDCLPNTGRMRRENKTWSWDAGEVVATLTSTSTANGSLKKFVFEKDASVSRGAIVQAFVDGVEVAQNSVTLSGNNFTVELTAAPASGSVVTATLINDNDVWRHTAAFRTLNDPDLGILPLYKAALGDLAAHIYDGADGKGMRYPGESRPGCASGSSSLSWSNRGALFMPIESEVWGSQVCGLKDQWNFMAQLPIFAGSQRRRSKGVGNGGSRTTWWIGSPYPTATHWCYVHSSGTPNSSIAVYAIGFAPGFLLS